MGNQQTTEQKEKKQNEHEAKVKRKLAKQKEQAITEGLVATALRSGYTVAVTSLQGDGDTPDDTVGTSVDEQPSPDYELQVDSILEDQSKGGIQYSSDSLGSSDFVLVGSGSGEESATNDGGNLKHCLKDDCGSSMDSFKTCITNDTPVTQKRNPHTDPHDPVLDSSKRVEELGKEIKQSIDETLATDTSVQDEIHFEDVNQYAGHVSTHREYDSLKPRNDLCIDAVNTIGNMEDKAVLSFSLEETLDMNIDSSEDDTLLPTFAEQNKKFESYEDNVRTTSKDDNDSRLRITEQPVFTKENEVHSDFDNSPMSTEIFEALEAMCCKSEVLDHQPPPDSRSCLTQSSTGTDALHWNVGEEEAIVSKNVHTENLSDTQQLNISNPRANSEVTTDLQLENPSMTCDAYDTKENKDACAPVMLPSTNGDEEAPISYTRTTAEYEQLLTNKTPPKAPPTTTTWTLDGFANEYVTKLIAQVIKEYSTKMVAGTHIIDPQCESSLKDKTEHPTTMSRDHSESINSFHLGQTPFEDNEPGGDDVFEHPISNLVIISKEYSDVLLKAPGVDDASSDYLSESGLDTPTPQRSTKVSPFQSDTDTCTEVIESGRPKEQDNEISDLTEMESDLLAPENSSNIVKDSTTETDDGNADSRNVIVVTNIEELHVEESPNSDDSQRLFSDNKAQLPEVKTISDFDGPLIVKIGTVNWEEKKSYFKSDMYSLNHRRIPLTQERVKQDMKRFVLPDIEETLPELDAVRHILEELHNLSPMSDESPLITDIQHDVVSPSDQLHASGSRTSITESDLDFSERMSSVGTDSMYADDEDDSANEVLFSKTYTEPVQGAEVLLSCTVVNSALQHASSDEFWGEGFDAYEEAEEAAESATRYFDNARHQMHDIQQHLQSLRLQMAEISRKVESTSLLSSDELYVEVKDRAAATE